jgi:translation initiation factor IF-2
LIVSLQSKVKHQLLQYEVQLEEFGGETQSVEISALTGNGLDQLIEAILLQAELKELTADPSGPVDGVIIEAKTVKSTGFMATVLVLNGTLRRGCILSTPRVWGRVRAMQDDKGRGLDQATPSTPVSVTGWKELPMAGEKCIQVDEVSNAREYIDYHKSLEDKYKLIQEKKLKHQQRKVTTTLKQPTREGKQDWKKNWKQRKIDSLLKIAKEREERHSEMREEIEVVPLIVKGDVTGSVEALVQLLESCQPKQININVMHSGVGGVTENDVMMANSINGIILAFNIPSTKAIDKLVKEKDVRVIKHNVIYKLLEQLKEWLESKLTPNETEEYLGEATVTRVFKLSGSKKAHVGGCIVVKGELARDGIFQLWRKGKMIHSSKVLGMKREKEDIRIAKKDTECGLSYKDDPGWEEGDRVICLRRTTVPQKLEWNLGFHKY